MKYARAFIPDPILQTARELTATALQYLLAPRGLRQALIMELTVATSVSGTMRGYIFICTHTHAHTHYHTHTYTFA